MKTTFLTLATTALLTSAAVAGNMNAPIIPAVIAVPPAVAASGPDWGGFYLGGMASFDSGDIEFLENGLYTHEHPLDSTTGWGGFAGYNFELGSMVLGGEIAYDASIMPVTGFPNSTVSDFFDIKARIGFAAGKALIYGVAGYSTGQFFEDPDTWSLDGFNYGAGVDFLITDHLFVGAEYLFRDMSGENPNFPPQEAHVTTQSAEIRIGYKF